MPTHASSPGGNTPGAPPVDPILACEIARASVDALADCDTKGVRAMVDATPRGLQRRRQIAMYLAHTAFGIRTAEVARLFGRDTTTTYHAYRQVEDARDDPGIDGFLDALDTLVVSLRDFVAENEGGAPKVG